MAKWTTLTERIRSSFDQNAWLALALLVCIPLYFANAEKYSVPMGYAGMFTQMAGQIAQSGFSLPLQTPYYGPGGVPFSYPPFGLYLLAVLIKLTGKYFIFLRLLPPLLGWISFIPLYYLTLEISKSRIAAFAAVIIAATSPDIYTAHAWAAGIVRAPAFLFSLASIHFFHRDLERHSMSNVILAGLFFGLTSLSHFGYALFCFLWIWWFTIFRKDIWIKTGYALISSGIGLLVTSIWLIPILQRYGLSVLLNAFGSHGGENLTSLSLSFRGLPSLVMNNLEPIISNNVLAVLVLVGVIWWLRNRKFALSLFFLLIILAFPESPRFVFLLGSIAAGMGLSAIAQGVSSVTAEHLKPFMVAGLLIPLLGFIWWRGMTFFSRQSPHLDSATLRLADYVQAETAPGSKYLALVKQDEAEWMPFLFQREPSVAQWGSEWLGQYEEQTRLMGLFRDCQRREDWSCVLETVEANDIEMEYVITYIQDDRLNESILSSLDWQAIFTNDRYEVWKRAN